MNSSACSAVICHPCGGEQNHDTNFVRSLGKLGKLGKIGKLGNKKFILKTSIDYLCLIV